MKILGIETSCDETAVSVLETKNGKIKVLSNTISSQIKLHAKYGGVVPNLAAREHVKNIEHVLKLALKQASLLKSDFNKIDLIAVTRGPGLGPALLVGITFAKTLAWKYKKPLVGVNHLEGHIYSNFLGKIGVNYPTLQAKSYKLFPILNLIVSLVHTYLVLMEDYGKYKIIGETLDDAVGEAFDKVARLLGLGYPGGPAISQEAEKWNFQFPIPARPAGRSNFQKNSKIQFPRIEFPRPMIGSKNYDFSYSGLKTSVLYKLRDLEKAGIKITDNIKSEICYEFQKAAVEVLIKKTIKAAREYKVDSLFLSGGVSANKYLRKQLGLEAKINQMNYSQPELEYTGDNAAMIALAGYMNYKNPPSHKASEGTVKNSWKSVEMDANLGF